MSDDDGPPPTRATLRDVARLAGVELSTASRVLRNDSARYRDETRQRVRRAAAQLGYRVNPQARALRLGRQDAIAMLVPDLDNFGFTQVLRGVQEACSAAGSTLLIAESAHRPVQDGVNPLLGRVDGALVAFATTDDTGMAAWLDRLQLPTVLVQRGAPHVASSVVLDEESNAALMVEHLVGLGHRRIAHVSGSLRTDTGLRRHHGFEGAVERHDLPSAPRWRADGEFSIAGGRAAALRIMDSPADRRPTAIAVDSLVAAIGTLSALRELHVRVPEEVSVISIDDHFIAGELTPPLTTIRLPQRELGRRAAQMLFGVIRGEPGSRDVVPGAEIIERASTAAPLE